MGGQEESVMDICIIGSGVIGTIYGHALAEAGNDVTHFVRPGHGDDLLRDGIELRLLDARVDTGRGLGVDMPVLASLRPFVEALTSEAA
jgi:2-polyprenyl-6-methoxyphenol hydroxylase-like FAD-dependent oxidoreductase